MNSTEISFMIVLTDSLRKRYEKNEDENRHVENWVLVAKQSGDKEVIAAARWLLQRAIKLGHTDSLCRTIEEYLASRIEVVLK